MKVTLNMIDELRSRVNVTYEEAKEALENSQGDIVQAIIELERKRNYKAKYTHHKDFNEKHKKIHKIISSDLIIRKGSRTYLHLPLVIGVVVLVFTMPFSIAALIILILTGFKIKISKGKDKEIDINEKVDYFASKVKETTDSFFEEDIYGKEEKEEGENEITIE